MNSFHVMWMNSCESVSKSHYYSVIALFILLREKFLQYDWLRAVVFQLNLKYLHVEIKNLLWAVV